MIREKPRTFNDKMFLHSLQLTQAENEIVLLAQIEKMKLVEKEIIVLVLVRVEQVLSFAEALVEAFPIRVVFHRTRIRICPLEKYFEPFE